MPFIEDSVFEQQEKKEKMNEDIKKKQERNFINDQAKPHDDDKPSKKIVLKEVVKQFRQKENKPEKITLTDIKQQLEINKIIKEETQNEITQIVSSGEVQEIKRETINLLATPHFHPVKRQIFARKLNQSEIINDYLDNNLLLRFFSRANQNLKFAVVYGLKYMQTHDDYEKLVLMLKEQESRQIKTDDKTPEPESEPESETELQQPE